MKLLLPVIIQSLIYLYSFAQENELDKYYPPQKVIQKNGVKRQIDTVGKGSVTEFDRLGRVIKFYSPENDTTVITYSYKNDTLIASGYLAGHKYNTRLAKAEKYVYNKKGQIIFYASLENDYLYGSTRNIFVSRFYYDNTRKLISIHELANNKYPCLLQEDFPVIDSLLRLINVFAYVYNKAGKPVTKQEMLGDKEYRYTDRFLYDKSGKLVKRVALQRRDIWVN